MDNGNINNEEWVSVSEMAQRLGITKQTVYNKIKQGCYETKVFKRGSMIGILLCVPKYGIVNNL